MYDHKQLNTFVLFFTASDVEDDDHSDEKECTKVFQFTTTDMFI